MKIILASKSLFRKQALEILGLNYETIPSHIDESKIQHEDPCERARLLSIAKAQKIGEDHKNAVIIGADLFLVHNNSLIEKPRDETHAKEMLRSLSGETFEIVTGLAVYNSDTGKLNSSSDSCKVIFRELSDYEIADYVSRYPVTKCAGAFERDGMARFASYLEGSYNFKTGLPLDKLIKFLRENEIKV